MSFKRLLVLATVMLAVSGVGRLLAQSEQGTQAMPSLGELARQQRAQREKAQKTVVKVYSNDDLAAKPSTGASATAGETSAEAVAEQPASGEAAEGTETATEETGAVHDEKYYRKQMSKLQGQLETHRRQLSVLEQKLSQGSMAYYADPQKTLEQESSPAFYSDLNKLRDDIAKKKQEIADDERAIEDLRDQLRREGAPAGWLR
jgi:predicted RNase H-like nuclease (RuvC/YqgF family)